MKKRCKNCGSFPTCYVDRNFIVARAQIICKNCVIKTKIREAFWASDAMNKTEQEWNDMN